METILFISIGIIVFIFFIIFIFFFWQRKKEIVEYQKEIIRQEAIEKRAQEFKLDITEGQKLLDYLDRLIKDKYQYHLYTSFLPIYLDKKIPEKNIVNEIKSKIYVTIVGGLTQELKNEILKYFTEKGIEIYVNEKIMIHMNETDFKTYATTDNFMDKLKDSDIDKMIM